MLSAWQEGMGMTPDRSMAINKRGCVCRVLLAGPSPAVEFRLLTIPCSPLGARWVMLMMRPGGFVERIILAQADGSGTVLCGLGASLNSNQTLYQG